MSDNKNSFSYQVMKEQEERLKKALEEKNNKTKEFDNILTEMSKFFIKFNRIYNVEDWKFEFDHHTWNFIVEVNFKYYGKFKGRYSFELFENLKTICIWGMIERRLMSFIDEREVELYENN